MEKNNQHSTVNRRNFTPAQKVAILKEHLLGSIPVSEVCLRHDLQPTIYYRWQTQFFENGCKAFEAAPPKPKTEPLRAKITQLEEKLVRKNEVVSELMETHLKLKKSLGEL